MKLPDGSASMTNDLRYVQAIMERLAAHGVDTWLFGGWAEELHGLAAPRHHRDVDLLHLAPDFTFVDRFLRLEPVEEIVAKRFPHKRAFVHDGVMTEIILVQPTLTTSFWGSTDFTWPDDVCRDQRRPIRLASVSALNRYRMAFVRLHGM